MLVISQHERRAFACVVVKILCYDKAVLLVAAVFLILPFVRQQRQIHSPLRLSPAPPPALSLRLSPAPPLFLSPPSCPTFKNIKEQGRIAEYKTDK